MGRISSPLSGMILLGAFLLALVPGKALPVGPDLRERYLLSFALISDNHNEQRLLRQTVHRINRLEPAPDFVVCLGDNVDNPTGKETEISGATSKSLSRYFEIDRILSGLEAPRYYVIGNHDYHGIAKMQFQSDVNILGRTYKNQAMNILYEAWHMPYRWYGVETEDYRLLFLDWNGHGSSLMEFSPEHSHAWSPASYQGFLEEQAEWIRQEAEGTEKQALVFTHFVDYTDPRDIPKGHRIPPNTFDLLLDPFQGRVAGVFYGHRHEFKATEKDGTPYVMISTNSAGGSCAQVVLNEDREISVRQVGPPFGQTMQYGPDSEAALAGGFLIAPHLRQMEPGSVRLAFSTAKPARFQVRLSNGWRVQSQRDTKVGQRHSFDFSRLIAGRVHRYQLGILGEDGQTTWLKPVRRFQSLPGRNGQSLRFVAYGSSWGDPAAHQRIACEAEMEDPQLVVHTGGMAPAGAQEADWRRMFFEPAQTLLALCPWLTVQGEGADTPGGGNSRLSEGSMGKRGGWRGLRTGPCHFFLIDDTLPLGNGSDQFAWLKKSLAESDAAWKIVVVHRPPFSACFPGAAHTVPSREMLIPLFEKYGVRVVLSGHGAGYEHSLKDSVHYLTTAGGGGFLSNPSAPSRLHNAYNIQYTAQAHYLVLDASADKMVIEAKDGEGNILDQMELSAHEAEATRQYGRVDVRLDRVAGGRGNGGR